MIQLESGGYCVWQWDKKQRVVLTGIDIGTEVHFSNCNSATAPVVLTYADGDKIVADVPVLLMQEALDITVYSCDQYNTKHCLFITVISRPQPDDYVYEEVQIVRYAELAKRIARLERPGTEYASQLLYISTDGYLSPLRLGGGVQIEQLEDGNYQLIAKETDPTVPAWAKQPGKPSYTAEEVGAEPVGSAAEAAAKAAEEVLALAKESGEFDGPPGEKGDPGDAPIKGVDYFTPDELRDVAEQAAGMVEVPDYSKDAVLTIEQTFTDEQMAQARSNIGAAEGIVLEASGEVIVLNDSSDQGIQGLKIYGKTIQNGTPTPEAPVELVNAGASGSIGVTVADESIAIQTPDGLPGIPVTSGGNYTDANGQQWIGDYKDSARGTHVHGVGVTVLTGTEQMGTPTVLGDVVRWQHNIPHAAPGYVFGYSVGFFSHGQYVHKFSDDSIHAYAAGTQANFYLPVELVGTTPAEIRAYTKAQYDAGTPLTLMYPLVTPFETDLTAEEITALHTNKLSTTIYNDAGAYMAVEYVADTKTYIDNKFAELAAALVRNA